MNIPRVTWFSSLYYGTHCSVEYIILLWNCLALQCIVTSVTDLWFQSENSALAT